MPIITISVIALYVGDKILGNFIEEQVWSKRIWYKIFPPKNFKTELVKEITATIQEYEAQHSYDSSGEKFPFYHSQIFLDHLSSYILFNKSSLDIIKGDFNKYPLLIQPTQDELNAFYSLFISKVESNTELKQLHFQENYQAKIFDIASSLERIESKIDNISLKITDLHSASVFNPDDGWFKNQCEKSIIDLGNRYTSKINFELPISKIFDGLGRTSSFKEDIIHLLDEFLIRGKKILNEKENLKEYIEPLRNDFDVLFNLFSTVNFESNEQIPLEEFESILDSITDNIENVRKFYRNEERKIQEEKKEYGYYHKHGYELRSIGEFQEAFYKLKEFLDGNFCKLANNPFLVLEGEAGIGKSHMLGDIISKRIENGYESIFLLGQHFTSDESPWVQIFKKLHINTTSEKFLDTLNQRARKSKKRIIIFIDAVNEGKGKYFWSENIKSFIHEIRKYDFLGLVLSIRSSYKEIIFSDGIKSISIIEQKLSGFNGFEYDASKLFFRNYNIQLPNVPLLHPEFQNPLFLKLFCDGINKSGKNKIPDGIQGISSIINFYVKNVNTILSNPNRFGYSNSMNLVDKSISAIIQYKVDNDLNYINYEKAIEIIEEVISKFVTQKGTYLDELISEGIFSKNLFRNENNEYEEGVYLAYERFEDHLLCKYLLEKYPDIENEFKKGGNLFKYIGEDNSLHFYRGLIEAFSIQIPEKYSKEFYEFVPNLKDRLSIIESFIDSILWRKYETINEDSLEYINEYVIKYESTLDFFWEIVLSVASIPEHYNNANFIHRNLMQFSMADRDAWWAKNLRYKYSDNSAVKRLIDWAWNENDNTHISDESIRLSAIALAWFLTSTNRQLRDCATKALVSLLQNRINVLIEVLKAFEDVNDPYVYERLFAVAYGCSVRTNQKEKLTELSEYIYKTIFDTEGEIYPHILLRDYARGVIEYTNYLGKPLAVDLAKIRPPYRSLFDAELPSDEEIDNQYDPKEEGNYGKEKWGITAILMSMGVEHGRKGYGDFGRYTFENALSQWNIDANGLSNLAIKLIIDKYGYDVKKHGKFDAIIGSGRGRNTVPNERIGKKYQWLALYEILARVADNHKKYGEYDFDYENEEFYDGPWNPYIRDIDPTILIKNTMSRSEDNEQKFWWTYKNTFDWSCSNIDWVTKNNDLPEVESLIQVIDNDNEEWLILQGFSEWAEPKKLGEEKWNYARKLVWCQIRSYIVNENDFEPLKDWAVKQDFMGRWMPESRDRYEVYNREYYWSPAYEYFKQEYYDGDDIREIKDKKTNKVISNVTISVESYMWEEEFDNSKEETIKFMKPSFGIFEGMNLEYSKNEGEFLDSENKVVCFATNVLHNSQPYFLIRKKPFLKYLADNKLNILWTVLGEKHVIGGKREDNIGMLEFTGAYYLTENKLKGCIHTKQAE
ncbi:ATP-binding protein [Elizabethkingia anophelis]|uniref:AVAST type 2 anti-phage system protein Avs2 n=1 Tax=Elizabethkingia anophelis TaxID=1117645 RepID=UPI00077E5A66|nr:AVAST type 2 anti-phage system protein Avs2 [Elizabethkingia anophelis]AMR40856.1 hypothetical protein A2T74_05520 [Elizabethkingia anophelis]AMX47492.1 hypothetical protein A4C56_05520 [Elizabethkingia anophelis]AMX50952.1 hypothetical protein A2T72_05520 [Elizabethkingia anophelis]AMX54344.1 hypothetical protein A2T59_05520 [Elizabethkingia anophelis]EGT4345468.1 ATP-binding protein [Elizabethkingia anophelis]